jgi:hypothetical protein
MGDTKRKRQEFLKRHPLCVYCGEPATTSDHCPPRSFFHGRHWPETYEFPACAPCNAGARLDEQALAVLIRSRFTETGKESDLIEWQNLAKGLRSNQRQVVAEWGSISRNEIRRGLRRAFGSEGDQKRQQGWRLINVGPRTEALTTRFMIKLSKALYYKHNNHVFDGVLYVFQIDWLSKDTTPEHISNILRMAPETPTIERNRQPLTDQFFYRFGHSPEQGIMYAVVQFSESLSGNTQLELLSFLSISRIEASLMNARALRVKFSRSLARRRQRLIQARVRSTTHRLGRTLKPCAVSERLTISTES